MDWKASLAVFGTIFGTIFLAELGDKTQFATLLYAADRPGMRWLVFAAASLALVVAAGIAVVAGTWVSQFISEKQLKLVAGAGFIAIGLWTLRSGLVA